MTTMQDRERLSRRSSRLDEELRFKATARRNKLLGLGPPVFSPSRPGSLCERDRLPRISEEAGHEDVVRQDQGRFPTAAGVAIYEDDIRVRMMNCSRKRLHSYRKLNDTCVPAPGRDRAVFL